MGGGSNGDISRLWYLLHMATTTPASDSDSDGHDDGESFGQWGAAWVLGGIYMVFLLLLYSIF